MRSAIMPLETSGSVLSDAELERLLGEDTPYGDLTTNALEIGGQRGRMTFESRQAITVCAIEEAARMLELRDCAARVLAPSGAAVAAGTALLDAQGSAGALHAVWKPAQTLVEYASGIASATARIVGALRGAGFETPVACTRKSFPGTKAVAAKAVACGGGIMHRLGLSETLLVFPEHRAFLQDAHIEDALAKLRRRFPEKKLVAEVSGIEDALRLAGCGVDVLQLERFAPQQVAACRQALSARDPPVLLAAAGGVNHANAVDFAAAGADLLVTSAPYFGPPAEVRVAMAPLPSRIPL